MIHVDEFTSEHVFLWFMGAEIPHKKAPHPLAYVYNLDPKGYFGEEELSSQKNRKEKEKDKSKISLCENSFGAPLDRSKKEIKIKDTFEDENLSEASKDGDFILPLDPRPATSSIIIEETIAVNISLTDTPWIAYIVASLPSEQAALLIDVLRENIGHFAWSY